MLSADRSMRPSTFLSAAAGCCISFPSTVVAHRPASASAVAAVSTTVVAASAVHPSDPNWTTPFELVAVAGATTALQRLYPLPAVAAAVAAVTSVTRCPPLAAVAEHPTASFDRDVAATVAVVVASVSPAADSDRLCRVPAAALTTGQLSRPRRRLQCRSPAPTAGDQSGKQQPNGDSKRRHRGARRVESRYRLLHRHRQCATEAAVECRPSACSRSEECLRNRNGAAATERSMISL